MRSLLSLVLIVAVLVLAPACQGLAQALGVEPVASAPTVNVNVNQAANRGTGDQSDLDGRSGQEANGDVGASGSGTSGQTATQTTTVDPEAIAAGAVEILRAAAPGSEAAVLAQAALSETVAGDPKSGERLLRRARAAPIPAAPAPPVALPVVPEIPEPAAPAIEPVPAPPAPGPGP